jgi:hypothetical protein
VLDLGVQALPSRPKRTFEAAEEGAGGGPTHWSLARTEAGVDGHGHIHILTPQAHSLQLYLISVAQDPGRDRGHPPDHITRRPCPWIKARMLAARAPTTVPPAVTKGSTVSLHYTHAITSIALVMDL